MDPVLVDYINWPSSPLNQILYQRLFDSIKLPYTTNPSNPTSNSINNGRLLFLRFFLHFLLFLLLWIFLQLLLSL